MEPILPGDTDKTMLGAARSAVRLTWGREIGTGVIVSDDGLVLTNWHLVLGLMSGADDDAIGKLHAGFWAMTLADEIPTVGLCANVFRGSFSVGDEVEAQRESTNIEISELFGGKVRIACAYSRYMDVRVVFMPPRSFALGQKEVASFPSRRWDFALLRMYDGGQPVKCPYRSRLSATRVLPGPVLTIGYPKFTRRLSLPAERSYIRDVFLPSEQTLITAKLEAINVHRQLGTCVPQAWTAELALRNRIDVTEFKRRNIRKKPFAFWKVDAANRGLLTRLNLACSQLMFDARLECARNFGLSLLKGDQAGELWSLAVAHAGGRPPAPLSLSRLLNGGSSLRWDSCKLLAALEFARARATSSPFTTKHLHGDPAPLVGDIYRVLESGTLDPRLTSMAATFLDEVTVSDNCNQTVTLATINTAVRRSYYETFGFRLPPDADSSIRVSRIDRVKPLIKWPSKTGDFFSNEKTNAPFGYLLGGDFAPGHSGSAVFAEDGDVVGLVYDGSANVAMSEFEFPHGLERRVVALSSNAIIAYLHSSAPSRIVNVL